MYNTRCTFPQHTHLPAHHRRSLSALLKDHVLVKVKVNGVSDEAAIAAIAQQLAQGAGAALLQVKGSTLLYADASQPLERLVQVGGPHQPYGPLMPTKVLETVSSPVVAASYNKQVPKCLLL